MDIVIVTGGSKGIGKSLAKKYTSENFKVYTLSRSFINASNLNQITIDLSDLRATKKIFEELLIQIKIQKINSIRLFNNAARLGKINRLENLEHEDIINSLQLNIAAPILLTNLFIKHTKDLSCMKQVINISSGAAVKPYEGWSVYCASKAALDMFTKTVAKEQIGKSNGVDCISLYPGVVDTSMQAQIRASNEADFKNLQRFIDLKTKNELFTTTYVAEVIYALLEAKKLANGAIYDIRNYPQINTI